MIEPGREWQARKLAEAAEHVAFMAHVERQCYAQGFADALTYLLGEMTEAETPTSLTLILSRYNETI